MYFYAQFMALVQGMYCWEAAVFVQSFFDYGVISYVTKRLAGNSEKLPRKIRLQYYVTGLCALVACWWTNERITIGVTFLVVAFVGFANSFAAYCRLRTMAISAARTGMLNSFDDIIAMGLGYLFLGEVQILTPTIVLGVTVSVAAALICAVIDYRRGKKRPEGGWFENQRFLVLVLTFSVIWGFAIFCIRYCAADYKLNIFEFVLAWYGGASLGGPLVVALSSKEKVGAPLDRNEIKLAIMMGFCIWFSRMFDFVMRMMVPLTISQPIQLQAEMVLPAIVGIIWFKEAKHVFETKTPREFALRVAIGVAAISCLVWAF